ncbi:SMC-Scp complex subunit ScpB [Weissella soli]|uniref:SMC-Scp complex subunit ScpB n=1 Tax=Weissella soli TaxID=155866 RepID=UPI0011BB842D|nr:SMC-Scp complex subunit ScpB [Weissella soli]QEA34942.1 SMC-Scp complex subunit ScpB [Weissella soli]
MTSLQQIEALLFVAGDEGITIAEIVNVTGFEKPAVTGLLEELNEKYDQDSDSALTLLQTDDRYQLVTKVELAAVLHHYFTAPLTTALSQASLEVLAIIAYKQPITRMEVDEIRGVQSNATIQKLVLRDLVQAKGQADQPGRPNLYGTSDYFLNYFGLRELTELPKLVDAQTLDDLRQHQQDSIPLMPTFETNETSVFDTGLAELKEQTENN